MYSYILQTFKLKNFCYRGVVSILVVFSGNSLISVIFSFMYFCFNKKLRYKFQRMLKKCRIFSALSDRIELTSKPGNLKFCPNNCPGGCYCFAFPDSIYHVAQDVQVFNIYNYYKIIFPKDVVNVLNPFYVLQFPVCCLFITRQHVYHCDSYYNGYPLSGNGRKLFIFYPEMEKSEKIE